MSPDLRSKTQPRDPLDGKQLLLPDEKIQAELISLKDRRVPGQTSGWIHLHFRPQRNVHKG